MKISILKDNNTFLNKFYNLISLYNLWAIYSNQKQKVTNKNEIPISILTQKKFVSQHAPARGKLSQVAGHVRPQANNCVLIGPITVSAHEMGLSVGAEFMSPFFTCQAFNPWLARATVRELFIADLAEILFGKVLRLRFAQWGSPTLPKKIIFCLCFLVFGTDNSPPRTIPPRLGLRPVPVRVKTCPG